VSTVVGTDVPIDVLHRLALGVELIDAVTQSPVTGRVEVFRESQPRDLSADFVAESQPDGSVLWRHRTKHYTVKPQMAPLDASGTSRFKMRYTDSPLTNGRPQHVSLRVVDSDGVIVPRRIAVTVRSRRDVEKGDEPLGTPIAAVRRTLRLAVFPGAGYQVPTGATALRGQIFANGTPVAWARVRLVGGNAGELVAIGFGDALGQFLLVAPNRAPGTNHRPVLKRLRLEVEAPAPPPLVAEPFEPRDSAFIDRLAFLPIVDLGALADEPTTPNPQPAGADGGGVWPNDIAGAFDLGEGLVVGRTLQRPFHL
jgi:hypothetical protein